MVGIDLSGLRSSRGIGEIWGGMEMYWSQKLE